MSLRKLPDQATGESLQKEAEDLLAALRAGDPDAVARRQASHPQGIGAAGAPTVADAQAVIARGYGLHSWLHLTSHVALAPEQRMWHEIDLLFQGLPDVRTKELPLVDVLQREADALQAAHRERRAAAALLIRSTRNAAAIWGQGQTNESDESIFASPLTPDRARQAVGRCHGFAEWSDVLANAGQTVNPLFEAGCDAIVIGDAGSLRAVLAREPSLVHVRSPYTHHATLLHHVMANGIESHREWQSPRSAPEIAEILLGAGADPNALCNCYGSSDNSALELLITSQHPAVAGVQRDLVDALCRAGVNPAGPKNDGAPLWHAITFGYTAAAEGLAKCGAPLDNLVFAAAVGDLAAVQSSFDEAGRLKPHRSRSAERLDARHMLEYALISAAAHGRRQVVEFLLTKGPDLTIKEPSWGNTALSAAKYHRQAEIVALLKPLFEKKA